jgi:thioesterase domain-containing protein
LRIIWERLLPGRSQDAPEGFFARGGDAALFGTLIADIRRTFGLLAEGLPFNEIADNPTIESLARLIDANMRPVSSPLVRLQSRGSRPPLFLIHAGGGYVFFYRAFASRLGPEYPVYGVQAVGDAGRKPLLQECRNIGDLADRYVDMIRSAQPRGPYALGGASLGGVIAFEMCRRLRAQGEAIAPPLLFSALLSSGEDEVGLPQRITTHLAYASHLGRPQAIGYVSKKIVTHAASETMAAIRQARRGLRQMSDGLVRELTPGTHGSRKQAIPPALMYRCSANLKNGARLLAGYTPGPYEGPVVLFRAAADVDSAPCWRDAARGGLEVHDMPGAHLDMMEEPAVRTTADRVRRYLDAHLR